MTDFEGDKLLGTSEGEHVYLTASQHGNDCEIELPLEQAGELRDWLADAIRGKPVATPKKDEPENAEDPALPQSVSDVDKLRILADVVDAQAPFGTDLADFKRRLQIVLGL